MLNLSYQFHLFLIPHFKPLGLKPGFEIGDFELYISRGGKQKKKEDKHTHTRKGGSPDLVN